jgi:hypothetical protein
MESGRRHFRHTLHDVTVSIFASPLTLHILIVEPGSPIKHTEIGLIISRFLDIYPLNIPQYTTHIDRWEEHGGSWLLHVATHLTYWAHPSRPALSTNSKRRSSHAEVFRTRATSKG